MKSFPFPADLIKLQQQWTAAYRRLADRPGHGEAELRRELIGLSCRISAHPYWEASGWSTAGRVELRQAAEAAQRGAVHARDRFAAAGAGARSR
ncbi:hypothetical protein [Streptomyces sp. NPDC088762]|uniref:hypothetical protein n=1 Tax=Streptomyces sp. NPDC088762 TaxID=3365891 RepID=UPI0037FFEE90